LRRLRAEVDVHRAVAVLHKVLLAGGEVRTSLFGDDHLPRSFVVGGDGPELFGRRIWRDVEPVGVATGKPVAVTILVGGDVARPDARRICVSMPFETATAS